MTTTAMQAKLSARPELPGLRGIRDVPPFDQQIVRARVQKQGIWQLFGLFQVKRLDIGIAAIIKIYANMF